LVASFALSARAQELVLQCDPAQTTARFTLSDPLHTVHGEFKVERCQIHFDPATGKISGDIVFDATSGQSGSAGRDRKMHKEVLESSRYPDISFRPDHVDGTVATAGASSVKIHGSFAIHGADHEMTAPVDVKLDPTHWSVLAHFPVPYVKWGMKNPSVLFLRVGDNVDIELQATGSVKQLSP
jgi:polyisoprenoid-binding protein YceI